MLIRIGTDIGMLVRAGAKGILITDKSYEPHGDAA
jgi:hypothetical protein